MYSGTSLLRTLWIEDTSLMKTLFAVPTTYNSIQNYLWIRNTTLYRTASWVPLVSTVERFSCIPICTTPHSQLFIPFPVAHSTPRCSFHSQLPIPIPSCLFHSHLLTLECVPPVPPCPWPQDTGQGWLCSGQETGYALGRGTPAHTHNREQRQLNQ